MCCLCDPDHEESLLLHVICGFIIGMWFGTVLLTLTGLVVR